MRISDWSSDVCSSDLFERLLQRQENGRKRLPGSGTLAARPAVRARTPVGQGAGTAREARLDVRASQRRLARSRADRQDAQRSPDRKSVVQGKSVAVRVDLGGRRIIKKKTRKNI